MKGSQSIVGVVTIYPHPSILTRRSKVEFVPRVSKRHLFRDWMTRAPECFCRSSDRSFPPSESETLFESESLEPKINIGTRKWIAAMTRAKTKSWRTMRTTQYRSVPTQSPLVHKIARSTQNFAPKHIQFQTMFGAIVRFKFTSTLLDHSTHPTLTIVEIKLVSA